MHFLYFVADRQRSVTPAELAAIGLAYAFDGQPVSRECHHGPDGLAGLVLGQTGDRIGYYADQVWRKVATGIYLGHFRDSLPTPDDLARSEQIDGYWLNLDDGHAWLAPTARRWEECAETGLLLWSHNFPQRLSYNQGRWVPGDVKPRYQRLWDLAMAYEAAAAEASASAEDGTDVVRFTFEAIDEMAVSAMQLNYRVGPNELDVLGIYDPASRRRIIDALLDNPAWTAWLKKKAAADRAGLSSSSGPEPPITGSPPVPATVPPAQG